MVCYTVNVQLQGQRIDTKTRKLLMANTNDSKYRACARKFKKPSMGPGFDKIRDLTEPSCELE